MNPHVVDVFKNQRGRLALWISHHVQKCHHIRSSGKILKYLDLPLYLLLLDGLEDLDDAFLIVEYVDALEHLAVLATTYCRQFARNGGDGSRSMEMWRAGARTKRSSKY